MQIVSYPAVFYYDKDSDSFTVAFHDLDIVTEGGTIEDAFLRAKEFLQTFMNYAKKYDEEIAKPSSFEEVKKNNKNIVFLVEAHL